MAGVAEKLYPPVIGASVPAFYNNNGTATITVPFSMNRAVSEDQVYSFSLKIKTAQSNSYITTLYSDINSTRSFIGDRVVKFTWQNINDSGSDFNKIRIGQFLKVQLAYNTAPLQSGGVPVAGYFSTVAVVKYTSMPQVYIKNAAINGDIGSIPVFKQTYTGVYQLSEDKNERPYSYNFYLYDSTKGLVEESGWQLHNTSINTIASESLQYNETTDTYSFTSSLINNAEYYIQYGVRTINNLEIYSPMYTCIQNSEEAQDLDMSLVAENNFEEGYVELYLRRNGDVNAKTDSAISIEIDRAEVGYSEYWNNLNDYTWHTLRKFYFAKDTYYSDIEQIVFKDYTIEQGVRYLYCFRQYNNLGLSTSRVVSNVVEADFEDMFLYDGKRQLKIRFNPKVSSFKITRQEQKIDTIGSKFPFMFRNGIVEYKEFPIGGLISYLADNNKEFFKDYEDLNILRSNDTARYKGTPIQVVDYQEIELTDEIYKIGKYYIIEDGKYRPAIRINLNTYPAGTVFYERHTSYKDDSYKTTQTLDSIGYNMRAERRFKLKLLEWLGNGEIKLFRSPAEGNYLVRLMNISLTPEDKLGRMIHSFQATAYEVEELSYKNLIELNFINIDNYEEVKNGSKSVLFREVFTEEQNLTASKKVNAETIVNLLSIQPAASTQSNSFIIRIGSDDESKKALIRTGHFNIQANGELPDIWVNLRDNAALSDDLRNALDMPTPITKLRMEAFSDLFRDRFRDEIDAADEETGVVNITKHELILSAAADVFGDAVLIYTYQITTVETGEISNIANVYVRNIIGSAIGPTTIQAYQAGHGSQTSEILQYYVLNFIRKPIHNIFQQSNINYYDSEYTMRISEYDENALYKIDIDDERYYMSTNGTSLNTSVIIDSDQATKITLVLKNNDNSTQTLEYNDVPLLDLRNNYFNSITIGAYYQLDYAYQEKITELVQE